MENENQSLFKQTLNDGVILGVILSVVSVLFYVALNYENMSFWTMMSMFMVMGFLPLIVGLIVFMVRYKKSIGGFMSYGQGLKYGTLVSLFAACIICVYSLVFNNFIDPDYTAKIQEIVMEKTIVFMEESGVPQDAIDQQFDKMEEKIASEVENAKLISPLKSIPMTTLAGFIISLILAAIIKKNKQVLEETY